MKSVNASTVSPVSGALPTSASSTSTSIGLNGSSDVLHELDAASTSIGLKPLVQSSTPPSPSCMGWGVPALVPARLLSQLRRRSLAPTVIPRPGTGAQHGARACRDAARVQGRGNARTLRINHCRRRVQPRALLYSQLTHRPWCAYAHFPPPGGTPQAAPQWPCGGPACRKPRGTRRHPVPG